MHLKAIVFLFLLVNTSFVFGTCDVLFVIDGSSYWPSFRGEVASVSTTGNILYSSSAIYANANFWLYGDGDQDQSIPNWFYSTKQDFLDNLAEVQSNEGKETIVGATTKLNRWQINNAVIVLYTASPQNLISIAGYNYTEQYRTLAIHLNDGVDMSPISDYSSPQMSEFGSIVELIAYVCRQLTTKGPSTTPILTTPTTTPIPIAKTLFVMDGSSLVPAFVGERIFLQGLATAAFGRTDMIFSANIWEYGDDSLDDDIPQTFFDNLNDVENAISDTQSLSGTENIIGATDKLNKWPISDAVIVLFTASSQNQINMAKYFKQNQTVGISLYDGVDMSGIADYYNSTSADYLEVLNDIQKVALNLPQTLGHEIRSPKCCGRFDQETLQEIF